MKGFLAIFRNECRAIVRSKTLALLLFAGVGWMFFAPHLFTGDGTVSGLREMSLHYSLGGVAALLSVSLLVSATGSIAKERAAKRLALTMVRPIRYFVIALAKIAAYVLCAALTLAVCATIEYFRQPDIRCRHVFSPVLPSVHEEAEEMYALYMASSNTPAKVKATKKDVVVRLLARRAKDRYDTIETNACWRWKFDLNEMIWRDPLDAPAARFRFSASYDRREDVVGDLAFGNYHSSVSNMTQAVIEIPMSITRKEWTAGELEFVNRGKTPLMLRPRRDVELLIPADSFGWNLLRAYLELVAMLSLLISFGVFLGAALGRPAALFTAISVLLLSEMTPSVIEQYADELETDRVDAVGLAITRAAADLTRPVSALRPMEALSLDECVESREVLRVLVSDLIVLPILFAILSALVLPRKQDL